MLGRVLAWFSVCYALGVGGATSYWIYAHQQTKAWIAWSVAWTMVIALAYVIKKPEQLSTGMFISKVATILAGVPVAITVPLYPPIIRLPFIVLLALSAVFAAFLFKDDLQIEWYAFMERIKQGRHAKRG